MVGSASRWLLVVVVDVVAAAAADADDERKKRLPSSLPLCLGRRAKVPLGYKDNWHENDFFGVKGKGSSGTLLFRENILWVFS